MADTRLAFDSLLTDNGSADLWSRLPRELAALFRPGMRDLVGEILTEIRATIPVLARPAESAVGRTIIGGIHQAILQFLDRLADPTAPQVDRMRLFRELALHDIHDDPILDVLQTAYRVGARVAWRHMAQVGERAGVPVATLCVLAEALFAYVDELSALSVEGRTSLRAKALTTVERRRKQLADALLSASGDRRRLPTARLAESARWPLPDRLAVVALSGPTGDEVSTLDPSLLADLNSPTPCVIAAEADLDLLRKLPVDLPNWRAAVGPIVSPADAADSLRWARRTLTLLPEAPLTWFEDHMGELWLLNEPFLIGQIRERTLAPLAGASAKQRDKLGETLLMWLETRGSAPEMALLLDVHPQTIRYRLRQLDRIFGHALADAESRFALEIALRAQLHR